jgi:anti-sigma factor RsiW
MAGEHPSDSTLLAYVEDELEGTAREAVEEHLARCETCAADVRFAAAGRDAARVAPLLEAPAGLGIRVRDEIAPAGQRWLGVVAPVAAALAVAGGIATVAVVGTGDGGGNEDAVVAEESGGVLTGDDAVGGGSEAPAGGEATTGKQALDGERLKAVAGKPRDLARELRAQGFDARVEGGAVVVRTDQAARLRRALANRDGGDVRVLLREP